MEGRISFGGVVAFIFADLIIAPLLNILAAGLVTRFARSGGSLCCA